MSIQISIVVPLYNEAESLPELTSWIEKVAIQYSYTYEIILVNDGSTDESWNVIQELRKENKNIKGISFRTNYGKSAALNEGFKHAKGEVIITMDADLQDSPDEIPHLFNMIKEEDFDLVSGWKQKRYDPIMKTVPSKFFNYVTSKVSGIKLHDFNCGLKAYKNKVIKSVEVYGEMHRYIPLIAKWRGFKKIGERVVQHQERKYGVTKFGLERFIFGFLDLLTISFVTRYRRRPMHFFGTFGALSFFIGLGVTAFLLIHKKYCIWQGLPYRDVVENPFFFLAILSAIIGVQLFLAGYLAELINVTDKAKSEYEIGEKVGFEP